MQPKFGSPIEIDDEGVAHPVSARKRETLLAPPVGRSEVVKSRNFLTILDWRSVDEAAREMVVSIGLEPAPFDPAFFFGNPAGAPSRNAQEVFVITPNRTLSFARISFGVENYTQEMFLDLVPSQSVVLSAAFIRVQVLNQARTLPPQPDRFQASITPASAGRGEPGRYTSIYQAAFGLLNSHQIPPFSKRVRIIRSKPQVNPADGNLVMAFVSSFYTVEMLPTELERVVEIPGNDEQFTLTKTGPGGGSEDILLHYEVST